MAVYAFFPHKRLSSVFNNYFKYSSLQHNHITRFISNKSSYLQRIKTHQKQTFFFNEKKKGINFQLILNQEFKNSFNKCIKVIVIICTKVSNLFVSLLLLC